MRSQLCILVGSCAEATFVGRESPIGTHLQGGAGRYPKASDHWRDVAIELAGPRKNPTRFMVGKDAGQKAEVSCRNCSSQQDGSGDLGNAHQRRRLPGSRTCRGGLTQRHKETENKKGIVQEVDPSNGQNDRIDLDRENQFGSVSASALRRDLDPTR